MKTPLWIVFCTAAAVLSSSAQSANVTVPEKVLETYVGQYELMPGFVLTIRKEGDRLTAQATGQPSIKLTATSTNDFRAATVDASLTFVKDKEGKVTQLVLHQNGDHEAAKISSTVPKDRVAITLTPKILDAYTGKYELNGEAFLIRRDGDKLRAQLGSQPNFIIYPESETNFFYKVVDAQISFVKEPDGKVNSLVLHQNGDQKAKKVSDEVPPIKGPNLSKILARDPKASAKLVDLTGKFTAPLTEQWHPDATGLPEGGNHLQSLPQGVQKLGGTEFDVRGLIQVTGTQAEFSGAGFPDAQADIKIGQKCKRLHMLQGTGWRTEDGTLLGKYVLHYAGGETATLNIVYGIDVRDWWTSTGEPKEAQTAKIAWTGSNPATQATGASLRLFERSYENPKPDSLIESMDFVSAHSDSAPFLLAVTLSD